MLKKRNKKIPEDDILVKRCQQGDMEAMSTLIVRYQDRLYNTILKICGNPDDAAELTQETFVKVIEKISSFGGRSRFYTWLFRVGVNQTLTYCRRKQKLHIHSLEAPFSKENENAANCLNAYLVNKDAVDPAELVGQQEIRELLITSMNKLDEQHRAVIILRDIEGMSYQDIADILETELGTVKSRINRARASLREILQAVLT